MQYIQALVLMCLHVCTFVVGGEFKRCAIDTLWYVTGKPGHYQIHHRVVEETDEELCLDRLVRPLCSSSTTTSTTTSGIGSVRTSTTSRNGYGYFGLASSQF